MLTKYIQAYRSFDATLRSRHGIGSPSWSSLLFPGETHKRIEARLPTPIIRAARKPPVTLSITSRNPRIGSGLKSVVDCCAVAERMIVWHLDVVHM